ncbi:MAG: hypothetical protein ACLTDV_04705 [Eubacterium sp.]
MTTFIILMVCKLYDNMPLVEPLEYRENKRIREFVIAIDTSGSCQGKTVERFLRKTWLHPEKRK